MPQLLYVPGFEGIRIHAGNYVTNTEGCLLPGINPDQDKLGYWRVWESRKTVQLLEKLIQQAANRHETVWCEMSRLYKV